MTSFLFCCLTSNWTNLYPCMVPHEFESQKCFPLSSHHFAVWPWAHHSWFCHGDRQCRCHSWFHARDDLHHLTTPKQQLQDNDSPHRGFAMVEMCCLETEKFKQKVCLDIVLKTNQQIPSGPCFQISTLALNIWVGESTGMVGIPGRLICLRLFQQSTGRMSAPV